MLVGSLHHVTTVVRLQSLPHCIPQRRRIPVSSASHRIKHPTPKTCNAHTPLQQQHAALESPILKAAPLPSTPPHTLLSRVLKSLWSVLRLSLAGLAAFTLPALVSPTHAAQTPEWRTCERSVTRESQADLNRFSSVSLSADRSAKKRTFSKVLEYKIREVLSQTLTGKLLGVILVAMPVIGLGGLCYKLAAGTSWRESLFKAYNVMSDVPGADACAEDNLASLIVANIIFVSGLLTFAVILGIVCDDISTMVEDVRSGNYEVLEEGHTVVLNCNKQLGSVLRQMAAARAERGLDIFKGPVIVMAAEDQDDLDSIVRQSLDGISMDVRTRSGVTHDVVDLRRIAADRASTIIWLDPEDGDEEALNARRAAAIASLKALGAGDSGPMHMVIQTPENTDASINGLPAVSVAVRCPKPQKGATLDIVEMYDAQNLDRLLAQCALQPGLGKVLTQIFQQSQDTCEIYVKEFENLAGMRYGDARRLFESAAVCGVFDDRQLLMNPSENYVIKPGDKLVIIADSLKFAQPSKATPPEIAPWVNTVTKKTAASKDRVVMVLCFGDECEGFLDAVGEFADDKVLIEVVGRSKPSKFPKKIGSNCGVKFKEGNPASYRLLSQMDLEPVDSVVIAGLDYMDPSIADAQVISSLMQIEDLSIEQKVQTPVHFVAPITSPRSQAVAEHLVSEGASIGVPCTMDLLLPAELSSGVLTQVAASPHLDVVFKDLVDAEGDELYIRDPDLYGLYDQGIVQWRDIMDVVRTSGETAVGYIGVDGVLKMSPHASSSRAYGPGDKLVVVAKCMTC